MERYEIQRFVNRAVEVDAKVVTAPDGALVRYEDFVVAVEYIFHELAGGLCMCPDCLAKRDTFKRRVLDGKIGDGK